MNTYEYQGQTFRAWSEMRCGAISPHAAHSWDGEHTFYGPYLCWGSPYAGPKHRAGQS